jgi:hypothetical protein
MANAPETTIRKACYRGGFADSKSLYLGTSNDVGLQWDGTNMIVSVAADDSLIEIGDSATTQLSTDVKWYANEASGASYAYFDASANLIYTTGVDLQFKDNDVLAFGTGAGAAGDISITWDATNLIIKTAADDSLIEIGDSAATQLSVDLKWYANENSGASYLYADASANLIYTTGVDLQFKDSDYLVFGTGSGATGDVQLTWDGTNLLMSATADDSLFEIGDSGATQKSFDVKIYGNASNGADYILWDASDSQLEFEGAARLNFTGADGATANTDGQIIAGGSTSTHLTQATANTRWISLYTDCSATSGSSYGARIAHYVIGAGGSGAAIRAYGYSKGAAAASVYGLEATAEINSAASSDITGELCAVKATSTVNLSTSGTVNVLNLTISTAASKTMHANSAFIATANAGDGTDIANLFYFGDAIGTTSTATLVSTSADSTATHTVKCSAAGTTIYLLATTTAPH